jgi:hypothetical protein
MSLRDRLNRLEAGLPDDPDKLCCLEGLKGWLSYRADWEERNLQSYLDVDDPPLELPVLPFGGICKKTGSLLCDFAVEFAQLSWQRQRRFAVSTSGLTENDL